MPFVEGQSVRDRRRRERQLPVEDALRIGREVALVADFGIARRRRARERSGGLSDAAG